LAIAIDQAECPVCGTVADAFDPGGHPERPRPDCRCPTCGSLERHRIQWLFLREHTGLFTEPTRLLHVAPEGSMGVRIRAMRNVDYLSADLDPSKAMVKMDLTDIDMPDDSFDMILASHVLEHIPDDAAAMREMRRVLRKGGKAVLAVPMWGPATREDLSITDPAERRRLYGQDDHVRMYGYDRVFESRLEAAGFDVTVSQMIVDMDPALRRRYRVSKNEPVHCCTYGQPKLPGAPTMQRDATAGDGQATVSWIAAPDDDPVPTGYVVTPYDGYAPQAPAIFESPVTTQTVTGLTNGVTYRFKVAAINEVGTGPQSLISNPVAPHA
jgi:SAM-dependent methyltransferase